MGCATGFPFKLWATYFEGRQTWQVKTSIDEHNCIWNNKNRLVTVEWVVEKYKDRIKNQKLKLGEMQEFIRELDVDVDVGEWNCVW